MVAVLYEVHVADPEDLNGRHVPLFAQLIDANPALRIQVGSRHESPIEVAVSSNAADDLVKRNLQDLGSAGRLCEVQALAHLVERQEVIGVT